MPENLPDWLDRIDGELASIRGLVARLSPDGFTVDSGTGALLISDRSTAGSEAFACTLFPGVTLADVARYEGIQRSALDPTFSIPSLYRDILCRLNGAWLFELTLFGLPMSMLNSPPRLDRSLRQPPDLATAEVYWRTKYNARADQFHFGSGAYSYEQSVAYLLNTDGSIEALFKNGDLAGEWPSFSEFLVHELSRTEPLYSAFEKAMRERASATPTRTSKVAAASKAMRWK